MWEENLVYEVGVWNDRGGLEEVTARAGLLSVAHTAFLGTAAARPGRWIILRQRAHVIRELNVPAGQMSNGDG